MPSIQHRHGPAYRSRRQLCWSCHKDFLAGQKVKHQPVENGECASCHDPHQSENKNLLLQKGNALCLVLPRRPAGGISSSSTRRSRSGDCLDCHAPHATNIKGLLKKSVKETCADCHADLAKKKDVHQPVGDGDCLACHVRARVEQQKSPQERPRRRLCWDCHDNFLEKAKFQHDVVEDCTACHDPHQSAENVPAQEGSPLTVRATATIRQGFEGRQGPRRVRGQKLHVSCHDPHVGTDAKIF
jgi:predicted CXXCH cytochrome family protein